MLDFKVVKCTIHQIQFRLGLCPDPAGELTALPQTTIAGLKGATSKGRGGRRVGKGEEKKGEGTEGR